MLYDIRSPATYSVREVPASPPPQEHPLVVEAQHAEQALIARLRRSFGGGDAGIGPLADGAPGFRGGTELGAWGEGRRLAGGQGRRGKEG